jgi:hypothetical protein
MRHYAATTTAVRYVNIVVSINVIGDTRATVAS